MPNRFEFLVPDIAGAFRQGRADVRQEDRERQADQELQAQQGRSNQFRQLAGQAAGAQNPAERQQLMSQAYGADPRGAMQLEDQFAANEERKQALKSNTAKMLMSVPLAARPGLYQKMLPSFRQAGMDASDEYTPEMDTMMQAFASQFGGARGGVQSTVVGKDGQYYTVDRASGSMTPTGVFADPRMQIMEQPGQSPYGIVTSRGPAGQVVQLGGGGQPQGAAPTPAAAPGMQPAGQSMPSQGTPAAGPVRIPTAGETAAEQAQARAGVELRMQPQIARQTAEATELGKTGAERAASLPSNLEEIQRMRDSINALRRAPGFNTIYGKSRYVSPSMLPGGEGADADARRKQIEAQSFLVSIEKMRGLGALSNSEGSRVSDAYTIATNPDISEEEAREAWQEVMHYLDLAEDRMRRGVAPSQGSAQPQPTSDAPSFASEAEAESAGLRPGTRVVIGGVPGTWQ